MKARRFFQNFSIIMAAGAGIYLENVLIGATVFVLSLTVFAALLGGVNALVRYRRLKA